jgi:membrane-associated HD superfamily phosphohydrolase
MSKDPIVDYYVKVFYLLKFISWYGLILRCIPHLREKDRQFKFIELWVLLNFVVSFILLFVYYFALYGHSVYYWDIALLIYLSVRVFEIVIYQVNVLLFDEKRDKGLGKQYTVKSYRRLIILLIHNYVEIIFWFGIIYEIFFTDFVSDANDSISIFQIINFSFVMMTTFGLSSIKPQTEFVTLITLMQSLIGLFMSLIILSRFISFLPVPKSDDPHEVG